MSDAAPAAVDYMAGINLTEREDIMRRWVERGSLGLVVAFCYLPIASGQDFCIELLRRHLYDRFVSDTHQSSYDEYQHALCKAYSEFKRDEQQGSAQGQYYAIGGSLSYSASQIKQIGEASCESIYSLSKYMDSRQVFVERLNPNAGTAIEQCARAATGGVRLSVEYPTPDQMDVNFFVKQGMFTKITGATKIAGILCSGSLVDAKPEQTVSSDRVLSASCERKGREAEGVIPGGTVTFFTATGAVTALLPARPGSQPPLPPEPKCAYNVVTRTDGGSETRRIDNPQPVEDQHWQTSPPKCYEIPSQYTEIVPNSLRQTQENATIVEDPNRGPHYGKVIFTEPSKSGFCYVLKCRGAYTYNCRLDWAIQWKERTPNNLPCKP